MWAVGLFRAEYGSCGSKIGHRQQPRPPTWRLRNMDVELKQNEEDAGKLADLGNAGWGAGRTFADTCSSGSFHVV